MMEVNARFVVVLSLALTLCCDRLTESVKLEALQIHYELPSEVIIKITKRQGFIPSWEITMQLAQTLTVS